VGTTLYGANSIGGTVNLRTDHYSPVRQIQVTSGFGSYDTRKFSISGNSGLIDDRYTLYGRFSRIVSDGYRRDAWTDLWSYSFAAARYDEKWTNRLNIFGGPEQTHLAYAGIPRWYLRGDTTFFDTSAAAKNFTWTRPTGDPDEDRKYNAIEWDDATDNFNQPHYQFITEYRPDTNWLIENTLFYIKGKGFFDDLWFGVGFDALQLDSFPQLVISDETSDVDTVMVSQTDLFSPRLWVENDFWGIIPRVTRKHNKGTLTVGGEFQWHRGLHWGEIRSVSPAPPGFVPGQRFYDYKGRKIVATGFAQEVFTPVPEVTLTGALQYSYKQYKLFDDRFPNAEGQVVSHTTGYNVLSPRFGVTVRPRDDVSVFGSVSYNEQEPTNEEIFDPKVFDADANSFFRNFDSTTGIGDDPVMKPERLIDYELGAAISRDRWRVEANLFYMLFKDEIVPRGQVSTISGRSIRSNASSSTHRGIEIAAEAQPVKGVTLKGNLAVNDNTFDEYFEFFEIDSITVDTFSREGNAIAGSPRMLANLRASYAHSHFSASAHMFHSGRLYIDNSNSPETEIDPYTVVNTRIELKLEPILGYPGLRFFVHVNNLLDEEYETGGAIDYLFSGFPLFIPAAKRNFYAGLRASL
jgi:iron complex outermembrane receptor protein